MDLVFFFLLLMVLEKFLMVLEKCFVLIQRDLTIYNGDFSWGFHRDMIK